MARKKTGTTFQCEYCDASFYRTAFYLSRTPTPRFCCMECRSAAIKAGMVKSGPPPGPRPYRQTGSHYECVICGDTFYRRKSYAARGINKTCGKTECKSAYFSGEGNPFWGKDHSPETKAAIQKHRTARDTPRPKRYTHTAEARAKISAAMKERWQKHRDAMLAMNPPRNKPREEQRHRHNFTPYQRRTWKDTKCAWCEATEKLELDHILPVSAGGTNVKENSQTLCRLCNLWKSHYIDRPILLATLAIKAAE